MVYYNENDPKLAPWLYELMAAGQIAPGYVDTRSIEDVAPDDLREFKQCHFFAGIGGWSYALRLAGWPDDRPVWTGSCPCQPFSAAGKGAGFADERHLWPDWHWLISQRRPGVIFGEQVASKDGLKWLDLVLSDLEVEGYAAGAFDLCAAGVGAPHIRQRLWIVAERSRPALGVGDGRVPGGPGGTDARQAPERAGIHAGALAQPEHSGREAGEPQRSWPSAAMPPSVALGPWSDLVWLSCRDGKHRPTQPGIFPLAHGIPGRVGLLRGAGNAIVPQAAAVGIGAYLDETYN